MNGLIASTRLHTKPADSSSSSSASAGLLSINDACAGLSDAQSDTLALLAAPPFDTEASTPASVVSDVRAPSPLTPVAACDPSTAGLDSPAGEREEHVAEPDKPLTQNDDAADVTAVDVVAADEMANQTDELAASVPAQDEDAGATSNVLPDASSSPRAVTLNAEAGAAADVSPVPVATLSEFVETWNALACADGPDAMYAAMLLYVACMCHATHTDYVDAANNLLAETCRTNNTDLDALRPLLLSPWIAESARRDATVVVCRQMLVGLGMSLPAEDLNPFATCNELVLEFMLVRHPELKQLATGTDVQGEFVPELPGEDLADATPEFDSQAETALGVPAQQHIATDFATAEPVLAGALNDLDWVEWPEIPDDGPMTDQLPLKRKNGRVAMHA